MTKNAKLLLDSGWYRVSYGWWHPDIGPEPRLGKAIPQRKAIQYVHTPEIFRC